MQNASHGIATPTPLPGYPQNPLQRDVTGNFLVTGQIADQIATHTASDIVVAAIGRGSFLFTGVMDNTDVFFKVARAGLGDSRMLLDAINLFGNPGRIPSRHDIRWEDHDADDE